MLCISSFFSLCKELDAELEVYWEKNRELGAGFHELFEPIAEDRITWRLIDSDRSHLLFSDRFLDNPRQRIYNFLIKNLQKIRYQKVLHAPEMRALIDSNYDFRKLTKYKSVYMAYWGKLMDYPFRQDLFQPKRHLTERIPKISTPHIGLHIRRTDHSHVIKETHLEKYLVVIEREFSIDKNIHFYVASDDMEVKEELLAKYPGKIVVLNKEAATRSSIEGMQSALIDLLTLSKSKKIYGSPKSTFAQIPAMMGGIELVDVSKEGV